MIAPGMGIDLITRVTLVFTGALLLSRLLWTAPAIARHRLWSATIALVLMMPLLIGHLPRIGIPGWISAGSAVPIPGADASTKLAVPVTTIAAVYEGETQPFQPIGERRQIAPRASDNTLGDALMMVWAIGAALMLLALILGLVRAWRLRGAAVPIRNGRLHDRLIASCTLMRIRRQVVLALSDRIRSPLAGGIFRPIVLLPSAAVDWDDELLDTVLRHELTHLRRHDTVQQLGARLAVAWYWFHPLAWIAAARAAFTREQACDEAVLALGARPSSYARSLVELAEFGTDRSLMPALARLRRPELEERVISILRTDRPARAPRRTAVAVMAIAAWTFTIAAAGPVIAQVPAPKPPAPPRAEAPALPPAPPRVIAAVPVPAAPSAPAPVVAMEPGAAIAPAPAPAAVRVPRMRPGAVVAPRAPAPMVAPPMPAAPAPPAPPAECGSARATTTAAASGQHPRLMVMRDLDGRKVCMSVVGKLPTGFKLTPLGELPAGVVLTLSANSGDREQLMIVTGSASGNKTSWRVDGNNRTVDAKAIAWRDAMLSVLGKSVRHNGTVSAVRADLERSRTMVAQRQAELASRQGEIANVQQAMVVEKRALADRQRALVAEQQNEVASVREVQRAVEARQRDLAERNHVAEIAADSVDVHVVEELAQRASRVQELAAQRQAALKQQQTRVAEIEARAQAMEQNRQRIAQVEQLARVAQVQELVARQRAIIERQQEHVADVEARTRAAARTDGPAVERLKELIDGMR